MASAPNLRVAPSLPASGNPGAAPAETGDFVSMLAAPLSFPLGGGSDARPSDGERVTQDNPTGIKFDSDGTSSGANAQDLLAGLIPIVQSQGDYPIAVTFVPAEPEMDDAGTEDSAGDSAEPTVPIIAAAIAPPIPVAPSPTPSAATAPARTDAAAVPGTPGAASLAQPVEAKMPAAPAPDPAADPAKPVQPDVAITAGKPEVAPRPTAIETQTTFRAAAEVVVTDDGATDPLIKAAEAASQQAASPPAAAVAAETSSRLQALRNALLPLGRAAARGEGRRDPGQAQVATVEPPRAGESAAPTAPADVRPGAADTATTPSPVQAPHATTPARPADPTANPAETIDRSIDRALDLARDSEWLDRLTRDIAGASDKDGILRFRLNPQSLGQLRVELSQTEQGTTVRLAVETEAARSLLADAQPRLLAEARAQGVRIAEASVHLAGSEQQPSNDPRRQDDARQGAMVRTPAGPASELPARERPVRSRSDRYA